MTRPIELRRSARRATLPLVLTLLLALPLGYACGGGDEGRGRPAADPAADAPVDRDADGTPDRGVDDPATPASDDTSGAGAGEGAAVCLRGEPFVAAGRVPVDAAGGGEADARVVSGLRWQRHEGCERFVVDLGRGSREGEAGGAAAGAGDVRAAVIRERGVVRVELRGVERAGQDAADARFDGPLARAAYVVRSPEGRWTFVDVHLAEPAEAHVRVLRDPARVVVDLRPGGGPVPRAAPTHRRVVVLEPRGGRAAYPLTVTGYARTFEANVVARLAQDGEVVEETFTTSTGWADAWGHFTLTFEDGPTGAVRLDVGEYSARDGEWEGVAVELEVR